MADKEVTGSDQTFQIRELPDEAEARTTHIPQQLGTSASLAAGATGWRHPIPGQLQGFGLANQRARGTKASLEQRSLQQRKRQVTNKARQCRQLRCDDEQFVTVLQPLPGNGSLPERFFKHKRWTEPRLRR